MYAMSCFWIAAYSGTGMVSGVSRRDMITYTTISVIMGNLLTMGVQNRIAGSVRSGSIFPLWFFPAGFRSVLELLPFMNIYQLPLGIYIGQYAMDEILLRTALQLFWCVALWLLFDILQKKMAAAVLIQGG